MAVRVKKENPTAVLRMLDKYAFVAKIDNFGPHVLRHTFSEHYLRGNPDDHHAGGLWNPPIASFNWSGN